MMQKLLTKILWFCTLPFAAFAAEEDSLKRINAHLLLKDLQGAYVETRQGLAAYPQSKQLEEMQIKVLAEMGDEQGLHAAWERYIQRYPESMENREILEILAWGYIKKGCDSHSILTRLMGMLASFLSNSSKGVTLVETCLKDHSAIIRGMAVELTTKLMDDRLKDQLLRLYQEEQNLAVRLEVIKAMGVLCIEEKKSELEKILMSDAASHEMKSAAMAALLEMSETAERHEIEEFANSPRAGLRALACEMVAAFDLYRDIDLLFVLVQDHSPEVRKAALQTLGLLPKKHCPRDMVIKVARDGLSDYHPSIAISAAWLLTLYDPAAGQTAFKRWLADGKKENRLLAAAALGATGKYGFPLISHHFYETQDPYIKVNLALAMLGQRVETQSACDAIYEVLTKNKERWMWDEREMYRYLAPSTVKLKTEIPQYPESINQMVRLELLQILAFLHYPHALEATRQFLKEKTTGIASLTIALLLTEGDEESLDLIRELTTDEDPQIRIQAILILAVWGRDESILKQLQQAYDGSDRETKERILEGLGRIGADSSIPFLVSKLSEPSQSLRLIAASSLLQCLYH